MKNFFSNSWVISIISGILVFFITNAIIMFKNKSHYKKRILDANIMVLNHLRGYVVDNGLPEKDIINAVKSSIAREYGIKNEELLSIREFCEELIKDIIGNIYISNDNKKIYMEMLSNYLKQDNIDKLESKNISDYSFELEIKPNLYISIFAGIITVISSIISSGNIGNIVDNKIKIIIIVIGILLIIMCVPFRFKKSKRKNKS